MADQEQCGKPGAHGAIRGQKQAGHRPARWDRAVAAALAVAAAYLALAGGARGPVRAAEGPELGILGPSGPESIDPGPGWPPGWSPPPAPQEIPPDIREDFATSGLKRLELRVQSPLPEWTRQYPYVWWWGTIACGDTLFAYAYATVDADLLWQYTGHTYFVSGRADDPVACTVAPVTQIRRNPNETPEEREQRLLAGELARLMDRLRGGPDWEGGPPDCNADDRDGAPDNILVCFNTAEANVRFDAPAYLDPAVGRVRVPIRFVTELMGGQVRWDPVTQTVTLHFPAVTLQVVRPVPLPGYSPQDWWEPETNASQPWTRRLERATVSQPEHTIVLTVGRPVAVVDGKEVPLDAPPVIVPPGRTMVPVRFIAEALGAKVYWVGDQPVWGRAAQGLRGRYQVHIYTRFWPFYEYPSWTLEHRAQRF